MVTATERAPHAQAVQPLPDWLPALLQLASPALPIGSFSYSQGLEAAAWASLVTDEGSALAWIDSHWRSAFAVRELPAVLAAAQALEQASAGCLPGHAEWEGLYAMLQGLDDGFLASRDSAEARAEARQTGAALLRWLVGLHPGGREAALARALSAGRAGPTAPICFALCGSAQGLPAVATRAAWGFAWLENQVQAAVKIVPLGQSAGQRLILQLRGRIADPSPAEPWSFSPLAGVMAMRHERQYTRLFRS